VSAPRPRSAGCADVGGTSARVAIADPSGRLLVRGEFPVSEHAGDPGGLIDRLAALLGHLAEQAGLSITALDALGVGIPGPLERAAGVVTLSPNLGWHDVPLRSLLSARLGGLAVHIDDDANTAAIGEGWLGAPAGEPNWAYVIVGTGLGAGLVIDHRLYRGAHDGAGELGHTTLVPDGPRCNCGNFGCLEALASGTAIAARATAALERGAESSLHALAPPITAAQVFAAAAGGEALSASILSSAGRHLGWALANLVNLLDAARVVLGGSVGSAGGAYLEAAEAALRRAALPSLAARVTLTPSRLGDDAGLLGAAYIALYPDQPLPRTRPR